MRIMQVMLGKGFGGAERSFVDLVLELCARGHEVIAVTEQRGQAQHKLPALSNLTTQTIRCYGSWDVLSMLKVRRLMHRYQPELFHTHLARAACIAGRAAFAKNIPGIAKTHNLVNLKYYRGIEYLVATTQQQQNYLLEHGRHPELVKRIPNFSRLPAVDVIRAHGDHKTWRIKTLGRFVFKKGFDNLIAAVAELKRAGVSLAVEIAGDGPERAALLQQINRQSLRDSVFLRPWVEDVATFLSDADLFVLPSRDEPFGIVILEAMANGVPIITTRTAGPVEILSPHEAWLTPVDSAEALAETILAAIEDPARSERASRALNRFRQHYSAERVVAQYEALYMQMISLSRAD